MVIVALHQSLVLLKPDVTSKKLTNEVISAIEDAGYEIRARRYLVPPKDLIRKVTAL